MFLVLLEMNPILIINDKTKAITIIPTIHPKQEIIEVMKHRKE